MSFNGTGTFNINSTGNPVVTATVISSTWANALTADLAAGLSNVICKDGQTTVTANIPFGGFKLTGIGAATTLGDGLSYGRAANVSALTVGSLAGLVSATAGLFSASDTLTRTITFNGTAALPASNILNAIEPWVVSATAATGTIAFYPSTQSALYYTTSSSGNWTVNFAWSAGTTMASVLATGQSVTCVFAVTQGATPHLGTTVQVDGTATGVTVIWQNGVPSAGNASGVDLYSFVILKTAATPTYTVFASMVQFK